MKRIEQPSDLPKKPCLMACRDIKRRLEKVSIETEKVKPGINMCTHFAVRKKIIQFLVFEIMISLNIAGTSRQVRHVSAPFAIICYSMLDARILIKRS